MPTLSCCWRCKIWLCTTGPPPASPPRRRRGHLAVGGFLLRFALPFCRRRLPLCRRRRHPAVGVIGCHWASGGVSIVPAATPISRGRLLVFSGAASPPPEFPPRRGGAIVLLTVFAFERSLFVAGVPLASPAAPSTSGLGSLFLGSAPWPPGSIPRRRRRYPLFGGALARASSPPAASPICCWRCPFALKGASLPPPSPPPCRWRRRPYVGFATSGEAPPLGVRRVLPGGGSAIPRLAVPSLFRPRWTAAIVSHVSRPSTTAAALQDGRHGRHRPPPRLRRHQPTGVSPYPSLTGNVRPIVAADAVRHYSRCLTST